MSLPADPPAALAPPTCDPLHFKLWLADMPSAVTVITCWEAGGRPSGATLSAVSSLSLEPPLMLACFDRRSKTLGSLALPGTRFLIHLLAEGQEALALAFAGKGEDKFAGIDWERGLLGLPQLAGSAGLIACELDERLPGGDHVIVTGRVLALGPLAQGQPLLYHRRQIYPVPGRPGPDRQELRS